MPAKRPIGPGDSQDTTQTLLPWYKKGTPQNQYNSRVLDCGTPTNTQHIGDRKLGGIRQGSSSLLPAPSRPFARRDFNNRTFKHLYN